METQRYAETDRAVLIEHLLRTALRTQDWDLVKQVQDIHAQLEIGTHLATWCVTEYCHAEGVMCVDTFLSKERARACIVKKLDSVNVPPDVGLRILVALEKPDIAHALWEWDAYATSVSDEIPLWELTGSILHL